MLVSSRTASSFVHAAAAARDVSIITPMYNAAVFLAETVESVLAQNTSASWELLLIDDGSEDNTIAIAQGFAQRFPDCIRVLQHPHGGNHGTSASRNLGIRHAHGRLLAFLDADDVWLPHMLHSQLKLMRRHPEAAMVYANAERTWDMSLPYHPENGPQGYNTLPPVLPHGTAHGLIPPPLALEWFLADETLAPCTCTVLVNAEITRSVGCFEESFDGLYDDQVFYAKVMLSCPVAVSTACVARYRRHPNSCCVQSWDNTTLQIEARQQFESWLNAYRQFMEEPQAAFATD